MYKRQVPGGTLGVRIDSAVYAGCSILPYYDSMIAKVITYGNTRQEAIEKMRRCLYEFVIEGVDTNICLLYTSNTALRQTMPQV